MNYINARTALGGAIYPFLHRLKYPWAILTRDVTEADIPRTQAPVLRWVHDSQVHDLYVDGMDTQEFLQETGLELSLDKGGYVLSKRISRLMRPYFILAFFDADEITISYLDQDADNQKCWDGAGLVSRDFLLRLIEHLPEGISRTKGRQLESELRDAGRVEFTLMTASGQDKGHALVMDNLEFDFILPKDTKTQVKLVDGSVFVGIVPVHSRDDMRLDIQSLVNLYPFFDLPQLSSWLEAEGRLFIESVRSGDIGDVMSRIDADTSLAEIESWYVREYYLSGGHAMCFASIVKSTINQHLKRLNHTTLNKLRLPIPGGRYYVAVDKVGGLTVARGEVLLDAHCATAWVNHEDWLDFIADVLGGADQDDALWCFPFTDFDDEHKILCWRSPNQLGEYVLLKPAATSHNIEWNTSHETLSYPYADSRLLPPRIDTISVKYLDLVDEASAIGSSSGQAYSVAALSGTIVRAIDNKGILGQYCNVLLLAQAVYGSLPAHPPAPLEQIIDASVKSGLDLSQVREWCFSACEQMLKSSVPIPSILHERLSTPRDDVPLPIASQDHCLDSLVMIIRDHIQTISQQRDELMKQTMPPLLLFQHALNQPDMLKLGAKFNGLYTTALIQPKGQMDYDLARRRTEDFLDRYSEQEQSAILRAALANVYLGEHKGMDSAVWQLGEMTEDGRKAGIAQRMLSALREIGLLDELIEHDDLGILTYPPAKVLEARFQQIIIKGVWFNWLCVSKRSQLQTPPESMSEVTKDEVVQAKADIARLSPCFCGVSLKIEHNRVYTPKGNLLGYVQIEDELEEILTIQHCIAQDGDLVCIIQ